MKKFLLYFTAFSLSSTIDAKQFTIAYVTTNTGSIASQRAEELRASLAALAQIEYKDKVTFSIKTHHFDVRERAEAPLPEAATRNEIMATSVMSERPDVIYAAGAGAAKLFATKTSTTPIVIGCRCNPGPTSRRWHLVTNLCRPERNITGFTRYDMRVVAPSTNADSCLPQRPGEVKLDNLIPARVQALRDSREPPLSRIGYLTGEPYDEMKWKFIERMKRIGVDFVPIQISAENLANLKDIYTQNKIDAAVVGADNFLLSNTRQYIAVTSAIGLPTIFPWDEADSGAWMHLGTKVDLAAEASRYIIAILKGTPIRELPVSFPTEYELVVNHAVAKSHGWVFPRKFLLLPQREAAPN